MAPTFRAHPQTADESLWKLPLKLVHKILELLVIECDPENRLFWHICEDGGDQPHLADLLTRDYCEYHHPEGQPGSQRWVERSKQILRAQYAVYATIRGNKIRDLLRVHPSVKEVVERHYTFLEPVQKKNIDISSPLGYWVNPEHDVVMPASIDHSKDFNPPPLVSSSAWSNVGHLHLRDFISPSPASVFPWSRVRNLHLPHRSLLSTRFEEVIHYLPSLKQICIFYSARLYTARYVDGSNPHTTTMKSLKRVQKFVLPKEQGSLGFKHPASSGPPSEDNDNGEVREAMHWCWPRGIRIVELDNTCGDCLQYTRFDLAVSATRYRSQWGRGG
ncbi:hypothetical protein F4782DRAFT_544269 [Xylaria castorea]|nr:hypothetical protein F4782DRAFT_544269 [Xylaria castorea]